MRLLACLLALFGSLLLPAVLFSGEVDVPIEKLTPKMIQDRVDQYLQEKAGMAFVKNIDDKVGEKLKLKGDQIVFEKKLDTPTKLHWNYQTDKKLSADQQKVAKEELELLLAQALSENDPKGKGTLIVDNDLKKLRKVFDAMPLLAGGDDSSKLLDAIRALEKRLIDIDKRLTEIEKQQKGKDGSLQKLG